MPQFAPCGTNAPVHLPSGVRITSVTVFHYDTSPINDPRYFLFRSKDGGGPDLIASSGTDTGFSGGFTSVELPVSPSLAVTDNANHAYTFLALLEGAFDLPHRVNRVAIRYVRQVSPAPVSASFEDVPTSHPYFRHIEALFDSGISAGCNAPPMFCPDRSITRGEMGCHRRRPRRRVPARPLG